MNQINKEKAKAAMNGAKEKAKAALSEIKTNFKADEGTEGVKKYKSMFANLWKSGTTGKATLVAASIVVLLLFKSIFFGGSSDGGFDSSKSVDVDTLVMKGLYMRQPGDEALKACKKIVSSSKNLVVVDFRNGIEREKDEATKAAEKKNWDDNIKKGKEDIEKFMKWTTSRGEPYDPANYWKFCGKQLELSLDFEHGAAIMWPRTALNTAMISFAQLYGLQVEWMLTGAKGNMLGQSKNDPGLLPGPEEAKKVKPTQIKQAIELLPLPPFSKDTGCDVLSKRRDSVVGSEKYRKELLDKNGLVESSGWKPGPWARLVLKNTNGVEVSKEDVVKNWLAARGYYPPSDKMIIAKKNLIEIAIREDGKREDELKGICFVWINDEGKVKEVYFKEEGMARIFNAGDLSTEEFAQALLKNYSDIPSFEADVKIGVESNDGLMRLKTYTWIYKDPRGFQVKLLDSAYYDHNGQKISMKALTKANNEVAIGATLLAGDEKRWFSITAIKPESARKFD